MKNMTKKNVRNIGFCKTSVNDRMCARKQFVVCIEQFHSLLKERIVFSSDINLVTMDFCCIFVCSVKNKQTNKQAIKKTSNFN